MKTTYYKAGNHAIALNFKVGSSSLARAIIRDFQPRTEALITTPHGDGNGTAYPEGRNADNTLWQGAVIKVDAMDVAVAHLLVRDPVEKFRSACQTSKVIDVEAKLTALEVEGFTADVHFWPQSRFLATPCKLYHFPEHLDALATAVGLSLPLPVINESAEGDKPTLSPEQQARVEAIYAADIDLHNSIAEAGQSVPPASLADMQAAAIQQAYDTAAAAFNSLPKGKQALWEPVRQAVASAILGGDFTSAVEILQTTPAIYEGAEADRDVFLALLAND